KTRAEAALSHHFRQLERDAGDDEEIKPEDFGLKGTAWVQNLDLDMQPAATYRIETPSRFLFMGGDSGEKVDGAEELGRVGRCLDWLYPDDLDTVLLRDAEADELQRLLDAGDNRPVLLVGPRLAGKTALIHEYVRRTAAAREAQFKNSRNTWLLAPARLISGMSYVGQWENRLLAIVKEARKREHLLYFDDLIGMFRAGQSACSSLNVAQVLKPYIERRDIRLLAEITPEAHRVLRERDRGLADLFHIVPVMEMSAETTLKVLVGVQRQLEDRERCKFELEVLPTVLDLERRYDRDTSFPGKGAHFLQQLAVKHRHNEIKRSDVLDEFHARSGLSIAFLDTNTKLERKEVLEDLGKTVVGQEAALNATADVVAIAKARLNDPERPLASFLFLGPTGVGKTQTAKAIAAYLFGDPERLVRFDMNEYLAEGAATRLIG
ncbi:MAG TPA: AAA family ATPase, partial [Chloroflexota bacterium]|nr:AAA family ATPase [Chloroflexota bacterium]